MASESYKRPVGAAGSELRPLDGEFSTLLCKCCQLLSLPAAPASGKPST